MAESNLGCGPLTVKYLVFFFNLIFFLSGLLLICVGAVAQGFFKEYIAFYEEQYRNPAIGTIILGLVIVCVSFFGCCGAKKENVCMLRTFSFLMIVLLLAEVAAGISVAILKSEISTGLEKSMSQTMSQYGANDTLVTTTWDDMQKNLHCCGTYNYTDWNQTTWSQQSDVPDSCCKHITQDCGNGILVNGQHDSIYQTGCFSAVRDSAMKYLAWIIGVAICVALIQVVGVWMSCCLIKAVRENYEIL